MEERGVIQQRRNSRGEGLAPPSARDGKKKAPYGSERGGTLGSRIRQIRTRRTLEKIRFAGYPRERAPGGGSAQNQKTKICG